MNLSWLPDAITVDVDVEFDVSVSIDDDVDVLAAALEDHINARLSEFRDSDADVHRRGTESDSGPAFDRFQG